jgi:hypothetical protein
MRSLEVEWQVISLRPGESGAAHGERGQALHMRRYRRFSTREAYVVVRTQRKHRLRMHVSALQATIDAVVDRAKRGREYLSYAEHLRRVNTQALSLKDDSADRRGVQKGVLVVGVG